MSEIELSILLPATGREYKCIVSDGISVQEATESIADFMQHSEPSFYGKTPDAALMLIATGQIQTPTALIGELGLRDGARLAIL